MKKNSFLIILTSFLFINCTPVPEWPEGSKLEISSEEFGTLDLSWSEAENVYKYRIYIVKDGKKRYSKSGIQPNTTIYVSKIEYYQFLIIACNINEDCVEGPTAGYQVVDFPPDPKWSGDISLVDLSETTIKIKWYDVEDDDKRYDKEYYYNVYIDGIKVAKRGKYHSDYEITFSELTPDKLYTIKIYPEIFDEEIDLPQEIEVRTKKE